MDKRKKQSSQDVTVRVIDINGLRSITSYMNETVDWLYRAGESQEVFERMMDDPRVGSLVEQRKSRVLLLDASITDGGDSAVDEAVRKYLDFNTFFNLNNILLNAVPFGLSAVEVIWERIDNLIVPTSFVPIPRTALSFPGTYNGDIGYMTPVLNAQMIPLDNPKKFLIHRNDTGNGDRWGSPVLRRSYWPWRFKNIGLDAWVFAAKKIGVPSILALFETRNEEDAKRRGMDLAAALSEWEGGSSGALGNIKDLKVIESHINDFNLLVETCNAEIAYAITGQSLATNQAQYGTRAQSDTHVLTFSKTITRDAYQLQQTDQQLVNAFCALNFPGRKVPLYDIDSTDVADWAIVREAIDRGIPVSKKSLYEKYKIPEPKDTEDEFLKTAASFGFNDDFFFKTRQ